MPARKLPSNIRNFASLLHLRRLLFEPAPSAIRAEHLAPWSWAILSPRLSAIIALALLLGACSSDLAQYRANWNWWASTAPAPSAKVAAADRLVGADGACPPPAGETPRGVALGMTECDVVAAVGGVPKVELSTNGRGERTAVLSYAAGERAGTYRFDSGLLVSIEAPETPPPAAKTPKRKARNAKS